MKTGAIILADRVTRESDLGAFPPMAQLDGTTVIKKAITTLRQAAISPIYVVTGYQAESLERHIAHHGTICVFHEGYEKDAWMPALKVGLAQAEGSCDQALVFPAEVALFGVRTVEKLVAAEKGDLVVPMWEGEAGFPVLMQMTSLPQIMAAPDGLACILDLEQCGLETKSMALEDRGVSLRIDTKSGYEIAKQYAKEVRDANTLKFDVKVSLKKSSAFFGPGVARFLLMVAEKGSMLAACQEMNMSYSKGWKMVKSVEDELGFPFLIRQTGGSSGGSSQLTEEGREFIRRYQAMQRDTYKTAEAFFSLYFSDYQ